MVKLPVAAYHHVIQKATGLFLDGNKQTASLKMGNGDDYQCWRIYNNSDGTYTLFQKANNSYCLESDANKAVYTTAYNSSKFQKWQLTELKDGTFLIKNVATELILDGDEGLSSNYEGKIYTHNPNEGDNQRWVIFPVISIYNEAAYKRALGINS